MKGLLPPATGDGRVICPMLASLAAIDDQGRPVDRHCIYEQCRFFDLAQRDCGLALASQAMRRPAEPAPPSPPSPPAPVPDIAGGIDRHMTEVRQDLLHSALEVQGVVREAAQAILARVGANERTLADASVSWRRALDEGLLTLTARLDERVADPAGGSNDAVTAQLIAQMNSMAQVQQQVAERLLEEMSLVSASIRKLEGSIATLEKKTERAADESLQIHQQITLVKGHAEKTASAMRAITEGSRNVLQAIEAQAQRDQADLARRRQEEAREANNRGVALYYRGALDGAHDAFRRAVELGPEDAEAHNNLGLVLSRLGRPEEATASFQEALRLDPKMGEALNNLGFLFHTTSQFERAAEMFGRAIDSAADSSIAYANLGNTFFKMKQPDKAVTAWRRSLELDPMNEHARRGLRMFQQDADAN